MLSQDITGSLNNHSRVTRHFIIQVDTMSIGKHSDTD